MSSDQPALRVTGLSKDYRIVGAAERHSTLADALAARVRDAFSARRDRRLRALDDVSFELARGATLGVIGRNGAGKSTLLKIISRVTPPSAGEVQLWGRLGSLLEVETGFHPELTGRENIYLKGAVLGMRRHEISDVFDEVVAFAGVEAFLETPVKRYSSGMRIRLGFAVAAHLRTEILLVDEVLAVGDVDFQRRCLGRMGELTRNEGRTLIFVSHQMRMIEAVCQRALLLDQGRIVRDGPVDEVTRLYETEAAAAREIHRVTLPELTWRGVLNRERLDDLRADDDIRLVLGFETGEEDVLGLHIDIAIKNVRDEIVVHALSAFVTKGLDLKRRTRVDVRYTIQSPRLVPGRYFLEVYAFVAGERVVLWVEHVDACVVGARGDFGRADVLPSVRAPIIPRYSIDVERASAV